MVSHPCAGRLAAGPKYRCSVPVPLPVPCLRGWVWGEQRWLSTHDPGWDLGWHSLAGLQ